MIIVYFSSVAWDALWQRYQQIMSRISHKGHIVIYVEGINILQTFFNKSLRSVKRIEQKGNIVVVRPIYFPLHYKIRLLERVDAARTLRLVRKALEKKRLDMEKIDILWFSSPYFQFMLSLMDSKVVIYDCVDDVEGFLSSVPAREDMKRKEVDLLMNADITFTISSQLLSKCASINSNTHLCPNGTDLFPEDLNKIPASLSLIKHPIIGYIGSIADWLDYDLLYDVILHNDDWSFVFVGPIETRVPKVYDIKNRKNVHFLGRKDHESLPAYLEQFDVCLIPFKVNNLTLSSSPIKLFEYFSFGKPVVSTGLDEVKKFGELVYLADASNVTDQIKKALNENNSTLVDRRKKVAKEHSWDSIVEKMLEIISSHLSPTIK